MKLEIVGGTYYEFCRTPEWDELYGSGFRAAHALSNRSSSIVFHTFADAQTHGILTANSIALGFELDVCRIENSGEFYYEHPFSTPVISLPTGIGDFEPLQLENALVFGTLETRRTVHAKRVVYDPQSPQSPESFYENGSTADELIWVANEAELLTFTESTSIDDAIQLLFAKEKVSAAVIKRGAFGAVIFVDGKEHVSVPAYITEKVFPIGSGDVFSAAFAYELLMEGRTYSEAASKASLTTACYVNTATLPISDLESPHYKPFQPSNRTTKKAYLAGPFFNMGQRWMIEQLRDGLLKIGFQVFSPFHDVGLGTSEVAKADLQGLRTSDIVVAILDGFDPGTMYEIGYARALDLPVIAFYEGADIQSTTMVVGTDCHTENDLSSLLYKAFWLAR